MGYYIAWTVSATIAGGANVRAREDVSILATVFFLTYCAIMSSRLYNLTQSKKLIQEDRDKYICAWEQVKARSGEMEALDQLQVMCLNTGATSEDVRTLFCTIHYPFVNLAFVFSSDQHMI
jgi:hypothetical protein